MRRTIPLLAWLGVASTGLAAQQVLLDARKSPMPLAMAETAALYPADLDGDGRPDLVVANRGGGLNYPANGSWVLMNRGLGRLQIVTPPDYSNARLALAVADLDGDGDADVLFANEVTLALGVGVNDGLGTMTWVEGLMPGNAATRAAVAVDLDGDGDADVCTGRRLFLNQGGLVFVDATATHLPNLGLTDQPALAVGDYDRDADPDLLLGVRNGQDRLLANDGSGRFTDVTATGLPVDNAATMALAVADLDGDGDLDVARACLGAPPAAYLNAGRGMFTLQRLDPGTLQATAVAVGDVDGDGDPDLAFGLVSGGVLLLRQATGWRRTVGQWEPGLEPTTAVAFADLDGDSDLDLLQGSGLDPGGTASPAQPNGLENRTFFNDGTGHFLTLPLSPLPIGFTAGWVAGGDFDGDGDLDVLDGELGGTLLVNDGFGSFTALALQLPVSGRPVVDDLDGDGDLDAVLVDRDLGFHVLRNPGNGSLTVAGTYALPPSAPAVTFVENAALGDLDGDGDLDLVLVTTGQPVYPFYFPIPITLWANDGTGAFTDVSQWMPLRSNATDVVLGDLDRDGDLDVVTDGGYLWLNQGTTFVAHLFSIDNNFGESHLALADLDGDGFLDLVAGNACRGLGCAPSGAGGWDVVHWNDGHGSFGQGQVLEQQSSMSTCVAVGDVDGDGDLDIVIGHRGVPGIGHDNPAENTLFLDDGARRLRKATPGEFPLDFDDTLGMVLGDVDADGDLDLVLANRTLSGGALRGKIHRGLFRHLWAPDLPRVGRPFLLEVHGAPLGASLCGALGPAFLPLPPNGTLGLDPAGLLVLALVPPPSNGRSEVTLPIPNAPGIVGVDVYLQALLHGASLSTSHISNRLVERLSAY